jgi:hypothetical protein
MMALSIPSALSEALGHMQRPAACPEDVRARIAALRVPAEEVAGTRGLRTQWWAGAGAQAQAPAAAGGGGGGWAQIGSGGRATGWKDGRRNDGRGDRRADHRSDHRNDHRNDNRNDHRNDNRRPDPRPATYRPPHPDRANMPRFGNKANATATTEDRMMDRIRGKMNRFTQLTYDTTKGWLSELLDSGETGFLSGFIGLVFEMAAKNEEICGLYAQLLTELMTAFPHLLTEMHRIYAEFIDIFVDAAIEPAVGSVAYEAYVALRTRRKQRRGYARFIGEIAKAGIIPPADLITTCNAILDGIYASRADAECAGLCEEYAECMKLLVLGAKGVIMSHLKPLVPRIRTAMDRKSAPGMSSKAVFALMDVTDLFDS